VNRNEDTPPERIKRQKTQELQPPPHKEVSLEREDSADIRKRELLEQKKAQERERREALQKKRKINFF